MMKQNRSIKKRVNSKVRVLQLSTMFFLFLLLVPLQTPFTDPEFVDSSGIERVSQIENSLAETSTFSGSIDPLSVTYSGIVSNVYDDTFIIDYSTSALASVTIDDGWTGSGLQTTIDSLAMDVNDVRNSDMNTYHNEKFFISGESTYNSEDVTVPDAWTLTKSITGSGAEHPLHGTFKMNDVGSSGYSGTMGWRFDAEWTSGVTVNSGDEIYLSQMVLVPYRDLYSAEITFNYRVLSSSSLVDQVFLFTRFNGYETEYHVFESGDTTDTWLSASVTIPSLQLSAITLPNSLLLEIGLQSNVDGSQSSTVNSYVYVDNVQLNLNVRPFPEQIDLKVNGTLVNGATEYTTYPYLPDDDNRDAENDDSAGPDLDGYFGDGILHIGSWGSNWIDVGSYEGGFQFPLAVPHGAVITGAYLELEPAEDTNILHTRIYAAGENTSGLPIESFTTGLPTIENRFNWVDTSIDWTPTDGFQSVRIRQRSPDLSPLLQAIVSDSDWNQTYVCVMVDYMWGSSYQADWGIKGSTGTNNYAQDELARLFVEYMIPEPEDTAYLMQYEKDITIQSSQVTADLTNFPVLVDIYDSDLRTDVQADGDDIVFLLGDDALDFEIESFDQSFNSSHAHLTAWVKIPNLSSTVDTVITMAYGNPNAESSSTTTVWDDYATVNHLNDDPSGTIYDSTSNNYDGTAYGTLGSADLVSGIAGGGIDFDGTISNDMISIGQIYTDEWTEVTISIWVNSDLADDVRFFSKAPSTAPTEHILTIRADSSNHMTARLRTDVSGFSVNSGTTFNQDRWTLMTWTWSASSGYVTGYINGTQVIYSALSGTDLYDSIDVFVIGNTDMTNDRFFDGTLDEARLSNNVHSGAWVATEFNNQVDPASFVSVGSERTLQSTWVDNSKGRVLVSTNSPSPITTDILLTMNIEGSGQSLDESFNPGATYSVDNGSSIVDWTAYVMVSPPNTTTDMNVYVDYPMIQWNPTAVHNPLGTQKTYGTDWDFQGGTITVYSSAIDYWGVWEFYFESWNYVEDLQVGVSGSQGNTATFDIGDTALFTATSPWITSSSVGLTLTDPTGSVWYTDSATAGTPGTAWAIPGFQYRMPLTISSAVVDADVTNYPLLVSFTDSAFQDTSKVQADGDDIVFVQNDIVLAHEIERFDQSSGLVSAWVKCNLSSTVSNSIMLYYGNPVVGSTESPSDVWDGNFDAVYHLSESVTNEGSGEAIYDSTVNGYDGTHNGNSQNAGIGGTYGQYFDGNDYISVSSTEGFDPSGDVTISGWFYISSAFTSSSASSMILLEKYLDGDDNFHIALAGTDYTETGFASYGSLVFGFETEGAEYVKWTQRTTWNIGWYHFACILDSDTPANNKIYINGADNTNAASSGGASSVSIPSGVDWHFGGYQGESSEFPGPRYLIGNLDEIRISSGIKSSSWLAVTYDNINSFESFVSKGAEVAKTSPELTVSKAIDSSAIAGLWTATMNFTDTGATVSNATGVYERNFIVQHDSTLTLNFPSDAVSDKIAYAVAGDPIYIEYELTDDITTNGVTGATVKMNWTISGSPTEVTMDDLGDGRYGKTLDTDDLTTNQQWRINIWSSHPYYNNDTDYFDLDLYHATNMTYKDVLSTPVGYDFKATLVFFDSYSDSPITGATIAFDNGTAADFTDFGGGEYGITIDTTYKAFGDYAYRFKATKAGAYLEDAYVNVTFTLRKHYTTISVSGNLVTPYGWTTDLTVNIIDTDTGGTVSVGSVSSWTFDPASYSDTTETPPGDLLLTLDTSGWSLGTETVTLSVTLAGDYYNPTDYSFDIEIRKHYTSVSVIGDFLTPHGYTTDVTIILTDTDNGATISSTADVASWLFAPASYSNTPESSPSDFDVTLDTSGWSIGTDTVTFSIVMSGIYENPANFLFDIEIRKHYTSVTVSGDLITPYGSTTDLTVTITDTDTGTVLGSTASISSWTFNPASYGDTTETPPGDFSVALNTSAWSVGTDTVTLSVTMTGIYFDPGNYDFDIEIRNHMTALTVIGEFITPTGFDTDVTVVITDLDTGAVLSSTTSVSSWIFTSSYDPVSESSPSDFVVTLTTVGWALGSETVTLAVTMTGNYNSPNNVQFDIQIRKHYTSVSIQGDLNTPYGFSTDLTIAITDNDLGTVLSSTTYITSWTLNPASYTDTVENSPGDFDVTLDTTSWSVATETITLIVVMSGNYSNPANYQFDIVIRNHYTAVSVTGDMVSPYGNTTDLTMVITDLDTNSVLGSTANVISWSFDAATQADDSESSPTDFAFTYDTSGWAVGTDTVTVSVVMSGIYDNPSDYVFSIRIRHLAIDVYNEPSDLIFPTGSDFKIIVRVNVTEPGIYFGNALTGLLQTEFSVTGYTINEWYNLGNGRYNFTLDQSNFPEGTYTITLKITTSSENYADTSMQITFSFRPALSEASSPDRAAVTPYDTDFNVTITYTDIDREQGITGASISAEGITFYNELDFGDGTYQVTIDVSGLAKGEHLYNLTIDKAGYDAAKLSFKVVIRIAYTYAIPTVGALDIPVGDDVVFYVEYWDIDHDVPIDDTSPFLANSTWGDVSFTYLSAQKRYRVDFRTAVDDSLVQNLIVSFNFSKGENYQFGIFNISVTIRTHYTNFRLVSAVEPTSYTDNITISVFYGDLDSGTGIASSDIAHRVWNGTIDVTSYLLNDTEQGGGYYTIIVPAPQFGGIGLQNFTIYFNWTGTVSTYENSTIVTSVNIIGEDSTLSLLVTAEPTPYLENMTYTLFFAALNGTGINNNTGNVFVSVTFVGHSVDVTQVDIWEIDPVTNRGQYSIRFNNSIFSTTGLIYMNVYIDWSKDVSPFYNNRTDTISVRVLARDTLIAVVPPSQTAYAENATFSFTFDDVTGALAESIEDDAALSFSLSLTDFSYTYESATRTFTVSFNTSQFGAIGLQSFTLNISWVGAPFYENQTGKSISVNVILRQTTLDFQSPAPTSYMDNVTFSVFWTDVSGVSSFGIVGANVTLFDGATEIPLQYYYVTEIGSGEYEVELSTEYKTSPGTYQVTVKMNTTLFYLPTDLSTRSFLIRYRSTLVTAEPVDFVPYNSSIEIILYYQDILTLADIGNTSFLVSLELGNGSSWIVTSQWQGENGYYVVNVETYNQPSLVIGTQFSLNFTLSYADQSPYYSADAIIVYFELRYRESSLERSVAPTQTQYDDFANFTVYYSDADDSSDIDGAQLYVYDGATPLTLSTEYLYSAIGNGLYEVSVLTSVIGAPGAHSITIWANWTSGSPYHGNASLAVTIAIITRVTNIEIITPPSQTNYLENVTFIVSFVDLVTTTELSVTKDLLTLWNGAVQLGSGDFSISPVGNAYEISINSTLLSSTLVNNYNLTVSVDWRNAPDYYRDDSTSTRYTLIARSTYVSIDRPANTAYGENATFTFAFIDSTNIPEVNIEYGSEMTILSNLSETPSLSFNAGTGLFAMSFNTSQFLTPGVHTFHLNISWGGLPFYGNKSLQTVRITLTYRQTQVDFQAPAPTAYGDNVTFTVSYLDISGATEIGIPQASLTLYYLGVEIPSINYQVTPKGDGSFQVEFYTGFFSEPGIYNLNASLIYSGTEFKEDNYAIRPLTVSLRSTILSADPVGSVGYGTTLDITLYYQDQLTLADIANSSSTFMTIMNDTGIPWEFSISWNGALGQYDMSVETNGHILSVGDSYTLLLNMSNTYQAPYYRWDTLYIQFTIRARTTSLDIFEGAQPTSYNEYIVFTMYYWDVDVSTGIISDTDFTVENETHTLTPVTDFLFIHLSGGYYQLSVNASSLSTLAAHELRVTAIWGGGAPYRNNAQRNLTVSVIERTTEVSIISPPSSTPYLDNVTFTFQYTDTISDTAISITANDLDIYANGSLLLTNEFVLIQVGDIFEVSINSTVLSNQLVESYNITIFVDWNIGSAPYYEDAVTFLRVSTRARTMFVEVGPIDTTPYGDEMLVSFFVSDDASGVPISDAIIYFECQQSSIFGLYTLTSGSGALAGYYNITFSTSYIVTSEAELGDFNFDLRVMWDPAQSPYYRNRTTIVLTGSVDAIWGVLQSEVPQPSSVQITDDIYVIVEYTDFDHGVGIENANTTIYVSYLATGIVPQGLSIADLGNGLYNISFSTIDINSFGNVVMNITATKNFYTSSNVHPSFTVIEISTALDPLEEQIGLYWGQLANVTVDYQNLLNLNLTTGATVWWNYSGASGYLTEIPGVGTYEGSIDTMLGGTGTKTVVITADRDKFVRSIITITLIVQQVPSDITGIEPAQLTNDIDRGSQVNVTMFLNDTLNSVGISDSEVISLWIIFEGVNYPLSFNNTLGFYEGYLPGPATALEIGFYTVLISAQFYHYNPASYSFKINLQQTPTEISLPNEDDQELSAVYSSLVEYPIIFSAPLINYDINNATVRWFVADTEISGYFTNVGSGLWSTTFNTTEITSGVWPITIRATPNNDTLGSASYSISLTITRIETDVIRPIIDDPVWGWVGNISFYYNDTSFGESIIGAIGEYSWQGGRGFAIDLGNGTYLVPIDTRLVEPGTGYSVRISFLKNNYQPGPSSATFNILEVPTALSFSVDDVYYIEGSDAELQVPIGDDLPVTFFYNDTDSSDGYIGGIEGAIQTTYTEIRGSTFSGGKYIQIVEIGDGFYRYIFKTGNNSLATEINGEYSVYVQLVLGNRTVGTVEFTIRVIEIPTLLELVDEDVSLLYDEPGWIRVRYSDKWPLHNNATIDGATVLVVFVNGEPITYFSNETNVLYEGNGIYVITFTAGSRFDTQPMNDEITIQLYLDNYAMGEYSQDIRIESSPEAQILYQSTAYGLPIIAIILVMVGFWVRVFSVPKKLRQINGQIKALRKGKIPKPIEDAKSRQQLLAELFIDTNKSLGITRTADMMPEESIPVDIPEMGELLIQLSILTNLSPEELDEFKADISKMKMSEQAAFVKEVIDQEAIRAARRDGVSMEEIIEKVEKEAHARLSGEEVTESTIKPDVDEPIFLIEKPDVDEDVDTHLIEESGIIEEPKTDIAKEIRTEEPSITEKLSDYEIEELRKDLQKSGVEDHEIETIIDQARELPRDLVKELLRSLGLEKE